MTAKIYKRISGEYGSSYGRIQDTGHLIILTPEGFTVFTVADTDDPRPICEKATRQEAERCIAQDWDAA